MRAEGTDSRDEVVLVLAPTGRDMPLTCAMIDERLHVACEPCADVADLCNKIRLGAGMAIIADEAMDLPGVRRVLEVLEAQLPWSDLPLLILSSGADVGLRLISELRTRGNVTVLDRPLRILTLVSAVQSALRARRRQYEVRDLLAETRNAVKQRDQFLAMLGHELRNPLATISNAMSVLDAASPPADALESEQREIIRRQNDHLARLVDDLLDVSRITSGKIALQRQPVDLCNLAQRAAQAIDGAARKQQHDLTVTTACEPIFINADPVRLEQVINNLLTNAIKYTPAGGKIELSVTGKDGAATLRVRDNGMGIASELLPRVFDLFTQSERALDRSQGGLGIGLTLVRALVEMHGGDVSVQSAGPGEGCEFLITLPQVETPRAAASAPVPSPKLAAGKGKRILIVEDQADARRALQRLLQIWGHHVQVAEDGIRAVELAITSRPDIALVDVGLPGLDGYEVARRVRSAVGNSIRLVALTGYGQPEDRERAYQAGFDLHLVKPVDRDQLSQSINVPSPARDERLTQSA
jgi:signal transduction histidine kinase/ActR/RegA family two-component response regulator